jgi:hypothetical protein
MIHHQFLVKVVTGRQELAVGATFFSSSWALMTIGEGTHNHERKVHSIIHKADEIYNPRLCTCMPYQGSYLILLPLVVLPRDLKPLVPLLPKLVVLIYVLTPLVHCI